jgi:hypothetical protein
MQIAISASWMTNVSTGKTDFYVLRFCELQTPVATSSVGCHFVRVLRVALRLVLVVFLLVWKA